MARFIFLVCSIVFLIMLVSTCSNDNEKQEDLDGEKLAKVACASCHKYPEPSLLDKNSWREYMLPRMGQMLGFYKDSLERIKLFEENEGGLIVKRANVYPEKPQIDAEHWQAIQSFYMKNAPDKLPEPPKKAIAKGLSLFEVRLPEFNTPPSTTYAEFRDGKLFIGDANLQSMLVFDKDLKLQQQAKLREGAVWINEVKDASLITVMGSFSPTDAPLGFVLKIPESGTEKPTIIADKLQRPVHTAVGDVNADGMFDMVVCEFGKWTGGLSLFIGGKDGFTKTSLRTSPGAIKAYLKDLNQDGNLDIIALFGQGNEGIWIYYGDGKGNFREENALLFSPSNGSSYFNLFDFNGDGNEDIIYCNGDNADFNPVLKYYHGIRIFLNDGQNHFEESFFYQLNGAYNAVPADFDMDGDMDIAAISFFPDFYGQPEESFVFLKNMGDMKFEAKTIEDPTLGRWIVMDGDDFDGDGDMDLVLGSLAFEVVPKGNFVDKWMENKIPFIVLENTTK